MMRFAVYLVGLLLVLAAIWVLLTQTGLAAIVPVGVIAVALLVLLGVGIMRGAMTIDEHHHDMPREVVETRQQVGDTEVRRSKLQ
ncbi:MAG: hypothetical protein LC624_09915 [Halobacteriales archaeon]|nr:hypothetical protein [Halobacteriales archaeon]